MTEKNPVEIAFKGLEASEALTAEIHEQFEHLSKFYDRIHGCRAVVETEGGKSVGGRFHVKLHLHVPGKELIVGHHPSKEGHTDAYMAVHDAFKTMARQLQEFAAMRRGEVKAHETPDE